MAKIPALIATAALLLTHMSGYASATAARVIIVKGSVASTAPSAAEAVPVVKGDVVTVGSTIQTGSKSDLLMSPLPGAAVRVMENNSVILTEADLQKRGETVLGRKAKLELQKGTVQVALDKAPGGATTDFKITTPQCVAAARGTIFSTQVAKGETTTVVRQGVVDVPWTDAAGKTKTAEVKAGMKVKIKETPDGLVQEGPEPATETELGAFDEFLMVLNSWGVFAPLVVPGPVVLPQENTQAISP